MTPPEGSGTTKYANYFTMGFTKKHVKNVCRDHLYFLKSL